jgi:ribosomal protein L11 methyltransferase
MIAETASQWLKITLSCPETTLEAVTDLLGVLSGSAVEQSPVKNGLSSVSSFFQLANDAERETVILRVEPELASLFAAYNLPAPPLECALLADEDWATSWQQFFTPFAIVPGLIITPSWEHYAAQPGERVIEIDPGMAFGTGQHASTKLALGLIRNRLQHSLPERMLDVGTGTGILAMAAVLFGAQQAVAIDNDLEAVAVAAENIAKNGLAERIAVSATDLSAVSGSFDLICANILHDVLIDMAPAIAGRLTAQGSVVLAGILRGEQEENIVRVYGKHGLSLLQTAYEDEWVSLLLTAGQH